MVKNPLPSAGDTGDVGLIPGSGRSPGEGNGYPLQCSHLGISMDRRAWQATVHGVARVGHDLATKPSPPPPPVPWIASRWNQSILKEINLECSLERLMLKFNLQYFGHLMQSVDSLEKTLMLGGIGGRKRRG